MFLRSISTALKANTRCSNKASIKALFDAGQKQIRKLSTADPKETPIDPLNYKVETCHGVFQDRTGKRKNMTQIQ